MKIRPLNFTDSTATMCEWTEVVAMELARNKCDIQFLKNQNDVHCEHLIKLYNHIRQIQIYGNIGWVCSGLLLVALMLQ